METFAKPRSFVDNPHFSRDRQVAVDELLTEIIDAPIRRLITRFSCLPCCFTLQCCFGHFLPEGEDDGENLEPLPTTDVGSVKYRIAYLALCIENSSDGMDLYSGLDKMAALDPQYIQFGSPDWFWNHHRNSYALQVEPIRFAGSDTAIIGYKEALTVQKVRGEFFDRLEKLVLEIQPE
jgi:hypothetical protein